MLDDRFSDHIGEHDAEDASWDEMKDDDKGALGLCILVVWLMDRCQGLADRLADDQILDDRIAELRGEIDDLKVEVENLRAEVLG